MHKISVNDLQTAAEKREVPQAVKQVLPFDLQNS